MASIQQTPQGPVLVLKESALQQKGKDAQHNNIQAAKLVSDLVRSSLGPRGLDKMLVDSLGDVTITNDGATMLKEIDVQHPAAKMLVEISKTMDNEVGDGTTSAVVLAGSLISKADELLKKEIHSSIIVEGYQIAAEKTLQLYDEITTKIQTTDQTTLLKVASTSMQSKLISEDSDILSKVVVDTVQRIATKQGEKTKVDLDNIKVEKKTGGSIQDTMMIEGIVLDKEIVHSGMPTKITNAKVALINTPVEVAKTEISAEIRITDPSQMQMFLDEEQSMLKEMVEKIIAAGANVLICQKGIDDIAQHYLAKNGILAVRRVKESDMTKLAKATGATITTNLDDLQTTSLGNANLVHQKKVESDKWVFIEGCQNPQSVTLLIRGGSQRVIDEVDRSINDAIMVIKDVMESPRIVPGGGSTEAYIASKLKEWADSFNGREQLAIKKYAEALETIPIAIAENAGMDPIDSVATLRSRQAGGVISTGINAKTTEIVDMTTLGILEPTVVKETMIKSSTEVACMILRIDDVIAVSGGSSGP